MRKISQIVNFDPQRNTFYRINKQTGQQSPSYRNGDSIRTFKPDVTGYHYLLRKVPFQNIQKQQQPHNTIQRNQPHTQKDQDQHLQYKTLDSYTRHEHKISEPTSFYSKDNSPTSPRQSKPHSNHKNKLLVTGFEDKTVQQKSQDKLNKQILNQTLSSYTKYMKQRTHENHSPKKNEIAGSEPIRDPTDILCTTISHFNSKQKQPSKHNLSIRKSHPIRPLPNEYSPKERSSKQRSLFLQCIHIIKQSTHSTKRKKYYQKLHKYKHNERKICQFQNNYSSNKIITQPKPYMEKYDFISVLGQSIVIGYQQ